jgi:hypothetical protein
MRHRSVNDPRAVAQHDQHLASLKHQIREFSREDHALVLQRLNDFAMAPAETNERLFGEVTALAFIIAAHAGITLMNEVALEKWGANGTERSDES